METCPLICRADKLIFDQCFQFIPLENTRKQEVLNGDIDQKWFDLNPVEYSVVRQVVKRSH